VLCSKHVSILHRFRYITTCLAYVYWYRNMCLLPKKLSKLVIFGTNLPCGKILRMHRKTWVYRVFQKSSPYNIHKYWEFVKIMQTIGLAGTNLWAKFQVDGFWAVIPHFFINKREIWHRKVGLHSHAMVHIYHCNVSSLWGEKPIFGPLSKWYSGMLPCRQAGW